MFMLGGSLNPDGSQQIIDPSTGQVVNNNAPLANQAGTGQTGGTASPSTGVSSQTLQQLLTPQVPTGIPQWMQNAQQQTAMPAGASSVPGGAPAGSTSGMMPGMALQQRMNAAQSPATQSPFSQLLSTPGNQQLLQQLLTALQAGQGGTPAQSTQSSGYFPGGNPGAQGSGGGATNASNGPAASPGSDMGLGGLY